MSSSVPPHLEKRIVLKAFGKLNPARADDRGQWLALGMIAHSVDSDDPDLFNVWDQISRQSSKYVPGECERQWSNFKPDGGLTVATLVMWAREDEAAGLSPAATESSADDDDAAENKSPLKPLSPEELASWNNRLKLVPRKPSSGVAGVTTHPPVKPLPPKPPPTKTTPAYATKEEAINAVSRSVDGKLVAVHAYPGEFYILRFATPNGKNPKTFKPIHLADDGYRVSDPPAPLSLYHCDKLPATGPVYAVEGEKKCDKACSIGLSAVTSSHGAQSAGKSDWTKLAGRDVVIFPDNDDAGEKYALNVAGILLNLRCRVKIVRLPNLPQSGDIYDFIENRTGTDDATIREEIETLATTEPWLDPTTIIGGPVVTCMADIEPREVSWLWADHIPQGRLTLIVGRPGEGKTFLSSGDFASRVSTGTPWPDGSACKRGSVLIISGEDNPHDTLRPRLDAHRADPNRINLLSTVRRPANNGTVMEIGFSLADIASLETALKRLPDCRLVVIDPIGSFLGGQTDAHRDNEVRSILAPVAGLAEKYNVAIVIIAHRRKGGGNVADEMALGSVAFTGIARSVWHVVRDSDNKDRRLFLSGKSNLSVEPDGRAFAIAGTPAIVQWEKEPVKMNANDAMAAERDAVIHHAPKRDECADFLRGLLASGPVPAKTVKKEAAEAGHRWDTMVRAATALSIERTKTGYQGVWMWSLPSKDSTEE